jgi:class 3 adenylate cyclase
MRDPTVLQAVQLADRLRTAKGEALDSEEYEAISEATGVSTEYVRFLDQVKLDGKKRNFLDSVRSQFIALDNDTRRMVGSGMLATFAAFFWQLGVRLDILTSTLLHSNYGIFQIIALILGAVAVFNSAVSRNLKTSILTGLIFATSSFLLGAVFGLLFVLPYEMKTLYLLPYAAGCTSICALAYSIRHRFDRNEASQNKGTARQVLLKQLVDLQEQLTVGEQTISFLSLDVVGSTKMKIGADALSVEFTFNEYHKYVEMIAEKHYGRVHSTAGDGVTVAFDHPQNAVNAAKQIQTGLVELNILRNKIGKPIVLRAGIHTGQVVAPKAGDVTSINFASVIDIAAHIQKDCPPGGVAVSDATLSGLNTSSESIGTERICVLDTWATVWQRKSTMDSFITAQQTAASGA